ncbi:hypothetical protein BGZ73_006359 [Actinomortierella ambigua]|nr:hypothetical protein BGZ73_006359 [Actinomortierella ambigua]
MISALSLVALLTSSDAASSILKVYNQEGGKGTCNSFPLTYHTCYTVTDFAQMKSAGYINGDILNDAVAVIFFETPACGGKWARPTGRMKYGRMYLFKQLGSLSGSVGSVYINNVIDIEQEGVLNQTYLATKPSWGPC